MNTTAHHENVRHIDTAPSAEPASGTDAGEQLTLLDVEPDTRAHRLPSTAHRAREVHARFQLSKQTRELGLRHVAEIRRQLEAARRERDAVSEPRLPRRRPAA